VEAVAIAGSDAARAAELAAEHGVEGAYGTHAELLDHAGLDAIPTARSTGSTTR
jgi:predicted dehydrogenase